MIMIIIIDVKNNTLTNKIVLAFDNTPNIKTTEYEKILELCKDYEESHDVQATFPKITKVMIVKVIYPDKK